MDETGNGCEGEKCVGGGLYRSGVVEWYGGICAVGVCNGVVSA